MAPHDEARRQLETLTRDLIDRLGQSWQRIHATEQQLLADWNALNRAHRLARARDLQHLVLRLMEHADELALRFTSTDIPAAYELGGAALAGTMGAAATFTQPDLDALGQVMTGTYDDLLAATQGVRASTKELIRRLVASHLADKAIEGRTAVQAGRDLAESLHGEGVTAVVYKDGSRHGLDEYAEMVARTKSAEAYQLGGFGQARALGVGWMELFDGPGCGLDGHDDPEKANGLILTLEQASAFPLSHPRCVRVASPRPDIRSVAEARHAAGSTSRVQDADQVVVAAQRAAAAARRSVAAQRFARRAGGLVSDGPFRAGSVAAMRHTRRVARRAG